MAIGDSDLPSGTVTFLFTDIEGSTQLWESHPDQARSALLRHDQIIEQSVSRHGGSVVRPRGEGDSRFAVFARATGAVAAAAAIQQALYAEPWPASSPLKVRMAVHTGEADLREGDYYGSAVNRCARLRSAAHGGQTLLGAATQQLVRGQLPEGITLRDLGEHLLRDLQQPEHIFQLVIPGLPSEFPPLKTLDVHPNNLPSQRTTLVGREAELKTAERLLMRNDGGLLTLTGPGGIGKTRLALQVAAELIDEFQDGVFFVSLAQISDPGLVAPTIAQALGVKQVASTEMVDKLADYLSDKRLLLLLDNFEQVIGGASLVVRLLADSPRLKVLITSREVLHVRDEQEFAVPALGVPDLKRLPSCETLSQYEAVALFIQRARLVKPDFEVTSENAPAVAEICYRLEGLPLAIELAAARIRLLPPEAILARLGSRLRLLTAGARDVPERQQTLRGTIQWSYDLLHSDEQKLFRRMSVFVGGGTLEAIESVCNADDALKLDVFDGVASLVDKSLVRQEVNLPLVVPVGRLSTDSEPRFGMLETIREYGTELLQTVDPAEGEELYKQHARYYLALAERGGVGVQGAEQDVWLDRLELEHDNLQSVLKRAIEQGDAEMALRIASSLWQFWDYRGYYNEGYQWLRMALALPGTEVRNAIRSKALIGASRLSMFQHNAATMQAYSEEGLAVFRKLSPEEAPPLAQGLIVHGSTLILLGKQEEGRTIADEGIAWLRKSGNKALLASGLIIRGVAATTTGDLAAARAAFEESAVLSKEVGNKWVLAQALNSLGDISRISQDYARAKELYEESLVLLRRINSRSDIPASLNNLGQVALGQGDPDRAKELFIEGLQLHLTLKNRHGIAECLAGLAGVAGAEKDPERAARLFGAAQAFRDTTGARVWPAEGADYQRNLANARAQVDERTWERAWEEGRAMSIEQAAAYALQQTAKPAAADGRS